MRLSTLFSAAVQLAVVMADLRSDFNQAQITTYLPGDSQYGEASGAYNRRFSFSPAAIVYPGNVGDVSKAIQIARNYNLPVSARSGGHSYVANGLGGKSGALVIDMSHMKSINVNSNSKVATIETGNRLGNVIQALNDAGRAMPHGTCPYVGIGGHAAYGGFGFASRLWGLTLDNIEAINIVLANGTQARLTANDQADLFWAARGAGPSFGVITSFEAKTYALPSSAYYFSSEWNLSPQQASSALQAFQSYPQQNSLPAELGAEIVLGPGSSGRTVSFTLKGVYYGSDGQNGLRSIVNPFINAMGLSNNGLSIRGDGSYIDTARILAEDDGGLEVNKPDITDTFYARSILIPESQVISRSASDQFMNYLANQGSVDNLEYWFIEVELWGGKNSKINTVPVDSTSFSRRDGLLVWQLYASSGSNSFPDNGYTFIDGAIDAMTSAMPSDWNYGAYTNYLEDHLSNWQQRYYGSHYDRLKTIKAQVDPQNVFSSPFGVEGASSSNPPSNPSGVEIHSQAARNTLNGCLAVTSTDAGARVVLRNCDTDSKNLHTWDLSNGKLKLANNNKCLDVIDGNNNDGTKLQIWDCFDGNSNQGFALNGNALQWTGTNKCVDLTDGNAVDGNQLQIWTCTGGPNQQWFSVNA